MPPLEYSSIVSIVLVYSSSFVGRRSGSVGEGHNGFVPTSKSMRA